MPNPFAYIKQEVAGMIGPILCHSGMYLSDSGELQKPAQLIKSFRQLRRKLNNCDHNNRDYSSLDNSDLANIFAEDNFRRIHSSTQCVLTLPPMPRILEQIADNQTLLREAHDEIVADLIQRYWKGQSIAQIQQGFRDDCITTNALSVLYFKPNGPAADTFPGYDELNNTGKWLYRRHYRQLINDFIPALAKQRRTALAFCKDWIDACILVCQLSEALAEYTRNRELPIKSARKTALLDTLNKLDEYQQLDGYNVNGLRILLKEIKTGSLDFATKNIVQQRVRKLEQSFGVSWQTQRELIASVIQQRGTALYDEHFPKIEAGSGNNTPHIKLAGRG